MIAGTIEQKIIDVLHSFIADKLDDALLELSKFKEDEFIFSIKFEKYQSSINAPAAKIIIDFQNAVYRIAALYTKSNADKRLLTDGEKQRLEIPFKISEGSTIEEAVDLLKSIKELLTMIPEEHRALALVAGLLIIFGYLGWKSYLSHQNEVFEYKQRSEMTETIKLVLNKMQEQNVALTEIISRHDKALLLELSNICDKVEFQNIHFTRKDLEEIKRKKYQRKQDREIATLKGEFTINDINIKESYLIVEENSEADPIRIYYSSEDLVSQMLSIKEHLKKAIDNESRRFYLEAAVVKKNKKVDTRVLTFIQEANNEKSCD